MKTIVVIVWDKNGPVKEVQVRFNVGPNSWIDGYTDGSGMIDFLLDSNLDDTELELHKDGYADFGGHLNLGLNGNKQVRIGMGRDPNRPEDIILRAFEKKDIPLLRCVGKSFYSDSKVYLTGADAYALVRRVKDGNDVKPFLLELKDLGFNAVRIFCAGSTKQNNFLQLSPFEDGYYDAIQETANLCNEYGLFPLLVVNVDSQDTNPEADKRIDTYIKILYAVRNLSALVSYANEWQKNLNGSSPYEMPTSELLKTPVSRGSALTDEAPFLPTADFMEFHLRRDYPKFLFDTVASPIYLYEEKHYLPIPLIIDEMGRVGDNGSGDGWDNPDIIYRTARHLRVETAGAFMHNYYGMRCERMSLLTIKCAEAFVRGSIDDSPW